MPFEPPIGSVVAYAGALNTIPSNWMVCDGRALDRNAEPELFKAIGVSWGGDGAPKFYLPDLRGQFLRGVDKAQDGTLGPITRDPDRDQRSQFRPPDAPNNPGNAGNDVGSFQAAGTARPRQSFVTDKHEGHQHGDPTWNGQGGQYELATTYRGPGGYDYGAQSAPTTTAGAHAHTIVGGGDSETRPTNAYVFWIIRAR